MALGGGGSGQANAVRAGAAFVELTAKSDQLKAGLGEAKQRLAGFAESSKKMFAGLGGAGALGGLLGGVEGLSGVAGLATMFGPQGLLVGGGLMLGKHLWEAATASDEVGSGLEKAKNMADLAAASAKRFADQIERAKGNPGELSRVGQNRLKELQSEMKDLGELKRLLEEGNGSSKRIRELEDRRGVGRTIWKSNEIDEIKKRLAELTTEHVKFSNGFDDASKSIEQSVADATRTIEEQTRAMQLNAETMHMSEAAAKRYEAAQKGVDRAILNANEAAEKNEQKAKDRKKELEGHQKLYDDAIKQQKDHKAAIEAATKALKDQIATNGMSPEEKAIFDLKQKGPVPADKLAELEGLAAEAKRLRDLPENLKKAFRAFGGGEFKGFGTSAGAFQSANFRQLLGGGTGESKQVLEQQKTNEKLDELIDLQKDQPQLRFK